MNKDHRFKFSLEDRAKCLHLDSTASISALTLKNTHLGFFPCSYLLNEGKGDFLFISFDDSFENLSPK